MVKLIAKILPSFEYYMCTGFGISSNYYRGKKNYYRGIGQGNLFSGKACKDKSCKIIRDITTKELGVMIIVPISKRVVNRTALTFIDNMSLYRKSENVQIKRQQIIDHYTTLYKAIEGLIEEQKSYFYVWQ